MDSFIAARLVGPKRARRDGLEISPRRVVARLTGPFRRLGNHFRKSACVFRHLGNHFRIPFELSDTSETISGSPLALSDVSETSAGRGDELSLMETREMPSALIKRDRFATFAK